MEMQMAAQELGYAGVNVLVVRMVPSPLGRPRKKGYWAGLQFHRRL